MNLEFSSTVAGGLGVIFLIVLLGPFLIKKIEHNLEVFLFSMGVLAVTVNSLFLKVSSETGHPLKRLYLYGISILSKKPLLIRLRFQLLCYSQDLFSIMVADTSEP